MNPPLRLDEPARYLIKVQGLLDIERSCYFGASALFHDADNSTTLYINVKDQAELQGLLRRLYNFGLPLLSLSIVLNT